ncbi:MAG TPA: hypothetical protein VFU43_03895 [Streptosporangiaceae bacterium]|nr:hypothetical protein [Streptosporangiaceae bacterium]
MSSPAAGGVERPARVIGECDPVVLGVHRAIGGGPLPPYVWRRHDELLAAVLDPEEAANRLVVLRGGSSTGKSRAAYQAVAAQLPHWPVCYPRTAGALARLLEGGIAARSVMWLNELRHYADAPGKAEVLFDLAELLQRHDRIVVITTVWPRFWAAYTAGYHAEPGRPDLARVTRELLIPLPELTGQDPRSIDAGRGGVIDVPDLFTGDELARARRHADPALAEAVSAAEQAGSPGRLTQYLAGVPDLVAHYAGPGADPYGHALITAALDAVRLGHTHLLSRDLLQDAAVGYLADRHRTVRDIEWRNKAWEYATRTLKGAVQALRPVPPEHGSGVAGYRVADYLDQHARQHRADHVPPAEFWDAAARHAHPAALEVLSAAAWDRGLYRQGVQLLKNAAAAGDSPVAARDLLGRMHTVSPGDHRPARYAITHIRFDNTRGVVELLEALHRVGAHEQVTVLAARAAAHIALDDPFGVTRLLETLWQVEAWEQLMLLLTRDPARHVRLDEPRAVARLLDSLRRAGAEGEQIETLLARDPAGHAALRDGEGVSKLLGSLRRVGANEQFSVLAERAIADARFDDPVRVALLLQGLYEAGADGHVAALLARDPAGHTVLHDSLGIALLLEALHMARADDQVTALLARRPADHTALYDLGGVLTLLEQLSGIGADDQIDALARRVAAYAPLDNSYEAAELLETLHLTAKKAHVEALAERLAAHAVLDSAEGAARLLEVMRSAGSDEQLAVLGRRAAAHAPIDCPYGVAELLLGLHDARTSAQAITLLARNPGRYVSLDDSYGGVGELLKVLRNAGKPDQVAALMERLRVGGSFYEFLGIVDRPERFRFGRDPDGNAAQPWDWEDLE